MLQTNTANRDKMIKHWATDAISNTGTGDKKPRRKKTKLVPRDNSRKPIIWEEPNKLFLIRIKSKNGNKGNRRKAKIGRIVGEIHTFADGEIYFVTGSTKTEVKRLLKKHPSVPKDLSINDGMTYF